MSFFSHVFSNIFKDPFNPGGSLVNTLFDPGQVFYKPGNPAKAAVQTQQQQDAAATAKAETDAAVAANQQRVARERAYQANALALGGISDPSLGAPTGTVALGAGSVLASGAPPGRKTVQPVPTGSGAGSGGGSAATNGGGGTPLGGGGGGGSTYLNRQLQR